MAAAIHTLDTLIQPPNAVKSVEAMIMLASLHSHPRPGVSSSDAAQERTKARELFDRARKALEVESSAALTAGAGAGARRTIVGGDDVDMYAEMARLWQDEDLSRSERALRDALRTSEAVGQTDPRLLNNLAVIRHLEKDYEAARETYENALTSAAGLVTSSDVGEGLSTTILYNLARVYEDSGEEALAKEAYEKLLLRHPEYIDGLCLSFFHFLVSDIYFCYPQLKSDNHICIPKLTNTTSLTSY
jgi:RNA polymerase-associated protein CTR9